MKTKKGFSLLELLIAMIIFSSLLALTIPMIRFYQREALRRQIDGDLRLLSAAMNIYHGQLGKYPAVAAYQEQLIRSRPAVLQAKLVDPFSDFGNSPYVYKLSPNHKYYLFYSVGLLGDTSAEVGDLGKVLFIIGNPLVEKWISNGQF